MRDSHPCQLFVIFKRTPLLSQRDIAQSLRETTFAGKATQFTLLKFFGKPLVWVLGDVRRLPQSGNQGREQDDTDPFHLHCRVQPHIPSSAQNALGAEGAMIRCFSLCHEPKLLGKKNVDKSGIQQDTSPEQKHITQPAWINWLFFRKLTAETQASETTCEEPQTMRHSISIKRHFLSGSAQKRPSFCLPL